MTTTRASTPIPSTSPVLTGAYVGGAACGVIGLTAGLVMGLLAYPPTAWAASIEIGLPATILGVIVGMGVGALLASWRRLTAR